MAERESIISWTSWLNINMKPNGSDVRLRLRDNVQSAVVQVTAETQAPLTNERPPEQESQETESEQLVQY